MLGAEDRSGFLLGATVTEFRGGKTRWIQLQGGTSPADLRIAKKYKYQLSNEKKHCLFKECRGWNPTQIYRHYNEPLKGSLLTNQYNGKWEFFFFMARLKEDEDVHNNHKWMAPCHKSWCVQQGGCWCLSLEPANFVGSSMHLRDSQNLLIKSN